MQPTIRLLVRHPSAQPEDITIALQIEPNTAKTVGTPRKTPKGTPLEGIYSETIWSYSRGTGGTRDMSDEIAELISHLGSRSSEFASLAASGASGQLILDLPGDRNLAAVFEFEGLRQLCEMGIRLGVEVYPP